MKDLFVTGIKNVKKFHQATDHINHRLKGVERMALVFGDPGLGKTETALYYAANNGSLYMRMKKLMTARWFLMELIDDLGGSPKWRTKDLFDQSCELLKGRKRTLILDEVDYFTQDSKVTETLRDIHDLTGTPMIFIGMDRADKRLMRYPHLWDRFVEVVKFQPLDREDIELMTKGLSDAVFTAAAVDEMVVRSEGKIRKIVILIHRAEHIARNNGLKSISAKDLR